MSISQTELTQIATLARLSLSEAQLEQSTHQMNNILSFIELLSEVNTDDIEPMAHPLSMQQRLREDTVIEVDNSKQFQAIAPKVEQDLYLVPTVIE